MVMTRGNDFSAAITMRGRVVKFQVGDRVREGVRVGTITDVGTMLIEVKTSEGRSRVVCPWELVKLRPA
jgi:hypothetical protein